MHFPFVFELNERISTRFSANLVRDHCYLRALIHMTIITDINNRKAYLLYGSVGFELSPQFAFGGVIINSCDEQCLVWVGGGTAVGLRVPY